MRVVLFSFRTVWTGFARRLHACRRQCLAAALCLVAGVVVGVLTACLVEEPSPRSVLGAIFGNTYAPFLHWGRSLLLLVSGIVVAYVSTPFRRRPLFWLFVSAVGYALGRTAAFCCMAGGLGVVSLIVCETPFHLLPLCFAFAYYCRLADVYVTTLRLRCNREIVRDAVCHALWGGVCAFVYIVVLWGLVALIVNIVV